MTRPGSGGSVGAALPYHEYSRADSLPPPTQTSNSPTSSGLRDLGSELARAGEIHFEELGEEASVQGSEGGGCHEDGGR